MRRLIPLVFAALGFALAGANSQLGTVHSVYLLPMGSSLDQYLATRLTALGMFQVVTDPQKADAVFTDSIGRVFEDKMSELYPPAEKPAEDEKKDGTEKPFQRMGGGSRGRGTVFLVDRTSRNVVWSVYWPIRSSRPEDVNRRAEQIAERLKKDLRSK